MKKSSIAIVMVVILSSFQTSEKTPDKYGPGLYAEFLTNKGLIICRLEYQKTPITVANFVGLAEGKIKNTGRPDGVRFYDGLTFHRCIHTPSPFMIQGGDPLGTGMGGSGYYFSDEFDPSLDFSKAGMLAMANSGANTNSSQFFITEAPTTWLNQHHSIFGEVVEGLNTVSLVNNGDTIRKLTIVRVGKDAEKFDAPAVWNKSQEAAKQKAAESAVARLMTAEAYIKKNYPKAAKTASGLYYVVLKQGNGVKAENGKKVSVHYNAMFADDSKFDSSIDKGTPYEFTLGTGQVIKGWDEGVALMNVGSKYRFIIPSNLGYGQAGVQNLIPANSTLIFDVELLDVK